MFSRSLRKKKKKKKKKEKHERKRKRERDYENYKVKIELVKWIRNESINETNVRMRRQTNLHELLTDHKSGVALSRNRANGLLRGRVCTSPSWAKKTGKQREQMDNTDRSVLSSYRNVNLHVRESKRMTRRDIIFFCLSFLSYRTETHFCSSK